jgi:hypothetical protein
MAKKMGDKIPPPKNPLLQFMIFCFGFWIGDMGLGKCFAGLQT